MGAEMLEREKDGVKRSKRKKSRTFFQKIEVRKKLNIIKTKTK